MGSKCDTNVILRGLYDSVSILTSQIEAHQVKTFKIKSRDLNSILLIKYQIQGVHECGTKEEAST